MKKRMLLFIPAILFVGIILLFKTLFFIGYVPTSSMAPTLKEGSIILGSRLYKTLDVGDIIVFEHDGGVLVKRIAAVSGQTIVVDEQIYIVPEDSFFVLGDNYENSYDSRFWENPYISETEIIAKLKI